MAMREDQSQRGFSLWELVVTMIVAATLLAIAVPLLSTSRRLGRVQETAALVASEMRIRAGRALRGTAVDFSIARDAAIPASIAVNPGSVTPPDTTQLATDVTFEGGTGDATVGGRAATVAVIVADARDSSVAYAVVAGRRGVVRVKRLEADGWRDWE
jgi:prepilin-type N-terminal cleavage/methylation domain-containing protein